MKIVHVNFARGFRGGERQTLNLMTGLMSQQIEQVLVCRPGSELAQRANALGLTVSLVSHPALGHLTTHSADLIHVHEARGAYWAAFEHLSRGTPYIITRRIPNAISASRITQSVYRSAQQLFGVSHDVARRLSEQTGRQVDTVLSCATRYQPSYDTVAELRKRITGGDDRSLVVGHVGAMHDHHKGQSVLIEAFHQVLARFPNARLVFVGDGPDRERFETLARGDQRIIFAGQQDKVGEWMAAMDIFAFPSREEGLGSSVLDAMACGLPVIAAEVGGLPELTGTRGERGILVDNHDPALWCDKLSMLLENASERLRLAEAGRLFARSNGVEAMSRRYFDAYRNILAHGAQAVRVPMH